MEDSTNKPLFFAQTEKYLKKFLCCLKIENDVMI